MTNRFFLLLFLLAAVNSKIYILYLEEVIEIRGGKLVSINKVDKNIFLTDTGGHSVIRFASQSRNQNEPWNECE